MDENPQLRELIGDNIEQVKSYREERKAHLQTLGNIQAELKTLEIEKQKYQ